MIKLPLRAQAFATPLFLFLASFLLRLALISKGPYHIDGLGLAIQSEATLAMGQLQPFLWIGYTMTLLLGTFSVWLAKLSGQNDPVAAVNLMTVTLSSLTIPTAGVFIRKVLNPQAAFTACVLLSVFPLFLSLSTFANSHIPTLFFLFPALIALTEYKTTNHPAGLLLAGILLGLTGASRLQDIVLLFVPISCFFFMPLEGRRDHGRQILPFAGLWGLAGLTILLVYLPMQLTSGTPGYLPFFNAYQKACLHTNTFLPKFNIHMIQKSLLIIKNELSFPGIAAAAAGLVLMGRHKPGALCFFLLWFLCPLAFYGNIFTATSRYLMLSLLPLIIGAGYAFSFLLSSQNRVNRIAALTLFLFLNIAFLVKAIPVLYFRHQYALTPDFARWVGTVTEPQAVIVGEDENYFVSHYAERATFPWPHEAPGRIDPAPFAAWLNGQLARQQPVYVTVTNNIRVPEDRDFYHFLKNHYRLTLIGRPLYEDWHHSTTSLQIERICFYKIEGPNP